MISVCVQRSAGKDGAHFQTYGSKELGLQGVDEIVWHYSVRRTSEIGNANAESSGLRADLLSFR